MIEEVGEVFGVEFSVSRADELDGGWAFAVFAPPCFGSDAWELMLLPCNPVDIQMKPIQLDGADGGGQMLRTALTLAMVTGRPFRMTNIRGKRSRPGLMRQHLTCVRAACEISGGSADGAEIGSTELVFRAGEVRNGSYQFAIGTAGSTSLVFQTLFPALAMAAEPSSLRLEGGTHNPQAPPFEFIERVFLPAARRTGMEAEVRLVTAGFAPAGGGVIEAIIQPAKPVQALDLTQPASAIAVPRVRVQTRQLPRSIAERMLAAAAQILPDADASIVELEPGPSAGICCQVEADLGTTCEITSAFGQQGVTAERVGSRAAKGMREFLGCGAPVGRHLADQLLLPMALAGKGNFLCQAPDDHLHTNIAVIESFLPVRFALTPGERGTRRVEVTA